MYDGIVLSGLVKIIDFFVIGVHFSAGLDFSTFKSSKKAVRLLMRLQYEAHRFQAMFRKAYKTCIFLTFLLLFLKNLGKVCIW